MAHILIMDDDVQFAFELRTELEKHNHEVTWQRNATTALETLNNKDIDLVISDIYILDNGKLVQDGGIILLGDMRMSKYRAGYKDLTGIPVIAISAAPNNWGNRYILNTAETVGAHYSLVKPLNYDELPELIDEILMEFNR